MTGASANQSSIFASSLPAQSLSDSPDGSASVSLLTLFHFFFSLTIYSPYSGLALSFTDLFVIFTPLLRSFHVHFSARRCQRGAHARDALPTPVITRALLFLKSFCFMLSAQTHFSITPLYFKSPYPLSEWFDIPFA